MFALSDFSDFCRLIGFRPVEILGSEGTENGSVKFFKFFRLFLLFRNEDGWDDQVRIILFVRICVRAVLPGAMAMDRCRPNEKHFKRFIRRPRLDCVAAKVAQTVVYSI
jgi:hypothetical protein